MTNGGPLPYSSDFSIVVPMAKVNNLFLRGTRFFTIRRILFNLKLGVAQQFCRETCECCLSINRIAKGKEVDIFFVRSFKFLHGCYSESRLVRSFYGGFEN